MACLAEHDGVTGYAELALDWVFAAEEQCYDAYRLADHHHVKNFLRGGLRYEQTTRYAGGWQSANVLALYGDRRCKLTGELHCLHFDWRLRRRALRQLGVNSISDLGRARSPRFWRDRLLLYASTRTSSDVPGGERSAACASTPT